MQTSHKQHYMSFQSTAHFIVLLSEQETPAAWRPPPLGQLRWAPWCRQWDRDISVPEQRTPLITTASALTSPGQYHVSCGGSTVYSSLCITQGSYGQKIPPNPSDVLVLLLDQMLLVASTSFWFNSVWCDHSQNQNLDGLLAQTWLSSKVHKFSIVLSCLNTHLFCPPGTFFSVVYSLLCTNLGGGGGWKCSQGNDGVSREMQTSKITQY